MPKDSLILINEIATLSKSIKRNSMGFVIKYESKYYIISTHHYLPIFSTSLNIDSKNIKLKKIEDIYWNELNIFDATDFKYLHNTSIIKSIKTRLLEPKTIIKMEICDEINNLNNYIKKEFECFDYVVSYPNILSNLRIIYLRFNMGKISDYIDLDNFCGLSGSPVLSEDNLVGVFCKYQIVGDNVYGLALPSIYLIKSLTKEDNKNLYYLKCPSYENIKIGQYEVQKINSEYFIHYLPINTKIPLDIFFSFEGGENKSILIKNTITKETNTFRFVKNTDFDISTNLIKKENKYKINNGLLAFLMNNYKIEFQKIVNTYINQTLLNDIWISFNDTNEINLEKLKI